MDIGNLIADIAKAAKTAATVIPGMGNVAAAIGIGEKLIAVIDGITSPDDRPQAEMQAARKVLAAAVSAKAERTADRFD
jgi:hypothetical protein